MRIRECGDAAILVEVDGLDQVLDLQAALDADPVPGVIAAVPAARTVLLRLDPRRAGAAAAAAAAVRALPARAGRRAEAEELRLAVSYNGADLGAVARHTGLTEREVVAAHTATPWTVAFCGFMPGFGYLAGGDPRLRVPRREESRTRVPAGAVGLAGEFTGVYPRSSPGGWQLIGHTDAAVWDLDREPPGLLRPGVRVRFEQV
ncbi:KipI family sensor histidine kinase inhibitor [Murinocardiopsis flavida]|uniref:KipI family sensor histidine kinase inhibitor n=1 Tax=Murinocardiopsis flavida TaxID=645275 RepID=A0A2P8DHM9_9ACTN|nr:allophanate hydrolase subunit 1 [Murinocardiopsis flavida]PSK96715.1 KipI family sensor histidine kinase inhibitor [Murinocardiopsis flavida]